MSLRKQLPCGKDLSYKLVPGPGGFAQALVGTEFEQTEVANLLLDVKKRPAAAAQKKPAAAQKEDCEEEPDDLPADPEEVEEPPFEEEGLPAKTYHKMWYKNSNNFGIRQKFGAKSQIFCLGGKKCTMSKEELGALADDAIVSMESGRMSEDEACQASRAKVL
jgi:hypothetical protein